MSIKLSRVNQHRTAKRIYLFAVFAIATGVIATSVVISRLPSTRNQSQYSQIRQAREENKNKNDFPAIETARLTTTQQRIVQLTKQEFIAQPPGTKYSQGQAEPWCADFVSWIMNEAGVPLKNPNSGSWRIPGTSTLADYYERYGLLKSPNSAYSPAVGDVVVYRGSPLFGDHTNIVLKNDNGVLTTIGGNENGRIRVTVNTAKDYRGLVGYGVLGA